MGRGRQTVKLSEATLRSEKPWVCPAWEIKYPGKRRLFDWMIEQEWPEGSDLTVPSKLHVTAFYSREGLGNETFQQWVADQGELGVRARVGAIESFDPGDRDTMVPVVLVLDSDELVAAGERVAAEAEQRFDIEPVRHPSGYSPHITVAKVPAGTSSLPALPDLEVDLGQLVEIHLDKLG